jgi:hypothetical protein
MSGRVIRDGGSDEAGLKDDFMCTDMVGYCYSRVLACALHSAAGRGVGSLPEFMPLTVVHDDEITKSAHSPSAGTVKRGLELICSREGAFLENFIFSPPAA